MAGVRVKWLGHSGFQITSPEGKVILIDPWFEGNPKAGAEKDALGKADYLLVTHDHFDHSGDALSVAQKTGATVIAIFEIAVDLKQKGLPESQILNGGNGMNVGGTVSFDGISFTMVQAYHSSTLGAPVGFIITLENGFTVYHAGDTGIFSEMGLFGDLYDIDLALLPVGSVFTMDGLQAAKALELLKPRYAIPMHYGTFPILDQSAENFVENAKKLAPSVEIRTISPGEETEF
ncbi:MAG: metal-dependent hydrolase [Deltaproteobacteria bacterium]|nr:MAG: metal-dependent hydrolase [Deltaproteobacteria bacterium]